ncbi:MAG TPA: hypothetical protein VKR53_11375 [Puia sp.]|nr:hypothetical protein [Puia sp.]
MNFENLQRQQNGIYKRTIPVYENEKKILAFAADYSIDFDFGHGSSCQCTGACALYLHLILIFWLYPF